MSNSMNKDGIKKSDTFGKGMSLDEQFLELHRAHQNLEQNPEDAEALCTGAVVYMLSQKYREAVDACEQVFGLEPVRKIIENETSGCTVFEKRLIGNAYTYEAIASAGLGNLSFALSTFERANALGSPSPVEAKKENDWFDACTRLVYQLNGVLEKLTSSEDAEAWCKGAAVEMLLRQYVNAIVACNRALCTESLREINEKGAIEGSVLESGMFEKAWVLERTYAYEALAFSCINESSDALSAFATANRLSALIRSDEERITDIR
jgi:tetratricopeptide (TPR) repeat protein